MSFISLGTIYEGDLTVAMSSDVNEYGFGDLSVNRNCIIRGTNNSSNSTTASFIVNGGMSIVKTCNIFGDLNILNGTTRLTKTQIDTTTSPFTCTGGSGISFVVGNDMILNSTGGSLQLSSGKAVSNAINLSSTNALGGINVSSGTNGKINLISGSDGFISTSNSGNTSMVCNNGLLNILSNTQINNQNLSIKLLGNTNSKLIIESEGNTDAILVNTTNVNGNLQISNNNGLGNGKVDVLTGSGGFNLNTNTGGNVNVVSQSAAINLTSNTSNANQNINLSLLGNTNSTINLISSGINNAISLLTTNTSGNIFIAQTTNSIGKVDIFTGSGGFMVNTSNNGLINLTANSAVSSLINNTTLNNQDMTLSLTGNTNSKINLISTGKLFDAIRIETTSNTGGILISSNGILNLSSNNTVNIATNIPGIPVNIGSTNSVTTINGNLNVKGTSTTINSVSLTIDDNITLLNNAPSGSFDAGVAIKRFQTPNNTGSGDVVLDIPEETGTVSNGSNSSSTVHLSPSSSSIDNYYQNWWIRVFSGTGSLQVRKIKSYNGSTRIATIYITGELTNVVPNEGLDLSVILDPTSQYNLYNCSYVMNIWDETANEFAFVCSKDNPTDKVTINHYTNLHVKQLICESIVNNVNNGLTADTFVLITLDNTQNIPQTIFLPKKYGVYQLMIQPLDAFNSWNGILQVSRISDISTSGIVNRTISSKGAHNEQVHAIWNADSFPTLHYSALPIGLSGSTVFKVKIISV